MSDASILFGSIVTFFDIYRLSFLDEGDKVFLTTSMTSAALDADSGDLTGDNEDDVIALVSMNEMSIH